MRAGAIDIGTNTVRLLVCDLDGSSPVRDVERGITFARLGEGVDRTGVLSDSAMKRAVEAIAAYGARWRELGCQVTRAIATSAVRDARNRDGFIARAREEAGVQVEVISGDEEARLSFTGATAGLDPAPVVVLDIGGGSTEVVSGSNRVVRSAVSLDIGAVRLTERHVSHDPPLRSEVDAMRADARVAIERTHMPTGDRLVGVAGTITTLAVLALGLDAFDPAAVQHATLTRDTVERLLHDLAKMTSAERRVLPSMPGREDVIVAGATILTEVMDHLDVGLCVVSVSDILDGTAIAAGAQASADGPTNAT